MERGTRYLFTSILRALHTANARTPLAWKGPASVASFAFGLPGSELPREHMAAHAASAALALRRGVHRTTAGKVGLALTAASIAGLGRVHARSRDADALVERALRDQLGEAYRDHMATSPLVARRTALPTIPTPAVRRRYVEKGRLRRVAAPRSTCGDVRTSPTTPGPRSCCRSTGVPGCTATRRDRGIR